MQTLFQAADSGDSEWTPYYAREYNYVVVYRVHNTTGDIQRVDSISFDPTPFPDDEELIEAIEESGYVLVW